MIWSNQRPSKITAKGSVHHQLLIAMRLTKFTLISRIMVILFAGIHNAHVRMHTHAFTCTHMHSHARTCIHMHAHAFTCTHMHSHAHTCIHMHTHAHAHAHTCTCTCTHMHLHAHTCTCTCTSCTCESPISYIICR